MIKYIEGEEYKNVSLKDFIELAPKGLKFKSGTVEFGYTKDYYYYKGCFGSDKLRGAVDYFDGSYYLNHPEELPDYMYKDCLRRRTSSKLICIQTIKSEIQFKKEK